MSKYDETHLRQIVLRETKNHFFWSSKPARQMKFLEQTSQTSSVLIVKTFVEKRTAGWLKTASKLPSLCHLRSNKSENDVKIWEDVKVTAPPSFFETTFNVKVPGLERYEIGRAHV